MATGSVSPKRGKVVDIPDQTVTIGTATDGGTGTTVSVPFTVGSVTTGGPVTYFTATSTPGSFTANGSTSPITVSGLSEGTAYTFKVKAGNPTGYSSAGESSASNSVTPVQLGAFESIATVTGTGSSGTITFSSIPSTYQHLQIRYIGRTTNAQDQANGIQMTFNSDTSASYARHWLKGNGASTFAGGTANFTSVTLDTSIRENNSSSNTMGAAITDIHDYKSTTKNKTVRCFGGADDNDTTGELSLSSGVWINTNAITSITLTTNAGSFTTSSVFSLYGIKGA